MTKFLLAIARVPRLSLLLAILFFLFNSAYFQGCAKNPKYPTSSTGVTGATSGLTNPSTIVIRAGSSVTFKTSSPANASQGTELYWYVVQLTADPRASFLATYGRVVRASDGQMLISLTSLATNSLNNVTGETSFQIGIIDIRAGLTLTTSAASVLIDSGSNPSTQDDLNELCRIVGLGKVGIFSDKSGTGPPVTFVDGGSGVVSSSCLISGRHYDCSSTANWPSSWRSLPISVSVSTRCGSWSDLSF